MALPTVIPPLDELTIFLGSNRYRVVSPVHRLKVTQPAPPIRLGQPTRQNDQVASSVIWEDLTGGLGVINMDEAESPDRFSDSDAWTLTKNLWTLPLKMNQIGSTTFSSELVGSLVYGNHIYVFYTLAGPYRISA